MGVGECAVEGEEAVIDLEGEGAQGGGVDSAAVAAPGGERVPASGGVALAALAGDDGVAKGLVPGIPVAAAKLVGGERAVVPIVEVVGGGRGEIGEEIVAGFIEGGVATGRAQELAAG